MSYAREIPRDLFNEADLLKCLGRLVIEAETMPGVSFFQPEGDDPFIIDQDESDGSISCTTMVLVLRGEYCRIARPLNSRDKFPVYVTHVGGLALDEPVRVFDETGSISHEFTCLVRERSDS
jgi:hypothetical protein